MVCTSIYLSTTNINSFYLGDKVSTINKAMQDPVAAKAVDMIKSEVSNFAKNSESLVKLLDEVGKMHPFIQGGSCSASIL